MKPSEDWRRELKAKVKEWNESNTFKLAEGDNTFRILPSNKSLKVTDDGVKYIPNKDVFFRFYNAHSEVGPKKRFVTCGKNPSTNEGDCWICDSLIPKLAESKKRSKKLLASKMARKMQLVLQVAVVDDGKWRGPKVMFLTKGKGRSFASRLLSFIANIKDRNFDDPLKGVNLMVDRTGTGLNTVYNEIRMEDAPTKVPRKILAAIKDLDSIIPEYSEQRQKAAKEGHDFSSDADADDDDDDDDDAEESRAKKHRRDSDDDDDDDDDGDGDDSDDDDSDDDDSDGDSDDDSNDDDSDSDDSDDEDSDDDDDSGDSDDDDDDDDDSADDDDDADEDSDSDEDEDDDDDIGDGEGDAKSDGDGGDDDDDDGDEDVAPVKHKDKGKKKAKDEPKAKKAKPEPEPEPVKVKKHKSKGKAASKKGGKKRG